MTDRQRHETQGVTSSLFPRLLSRYLSLAGHQRLASMVEQRHLRPGQDMIQVSAFCETLQQVSDALGDPILGARVGQVVRPEDVGVLAAALYASATIRDALRLFERFYQLTNRQNILVIVERADVTELRWRAWQGLPPPSFAEIGLSAMQKFVSDVFKRTVTYLSLDLRSSIPPPPYRAEMEAIFGCPIRYHARNTVVRLDQKRLDATLPTAAPPLRPILLAELERSPWVQPADSLAHAVVAAVRTVTAAGVPTLHRVAEQMGISAEVLRARMRSQRIHFRELQEAALRERSVELAADETLPTARIAEMLGYADHTSFSRAFKRWHGLNPRRWRKQRQT